LKARQIAIYNVFAYFFRNFCEILGIVLRLILELDIPKLQVITSTAQDKNDG
jgi:hypothetical protein